MYLQVVVWLKNNVSCKTVRHCLPQNKSRQILFAYLVYIKEELDCRTDAIDMNELRQHAVVMTNQGPRTPAKQPVHFSTAYGNKLDLPRLLPGRLIQVYARCTASYVNYMYMNI